MSDINQTHSGTGDNVAGDKFGGDKVLGNKIIIEAEKFNHDLTLQFGLIASSSENEKEYLFKAKKLIKEIQGLEKPDLSSMFFGSPPDKINLLATLKKIQDNISEVEKISADKRHYDF